MRAWQTVARIVVWVGALSCTAAMVLAALGVLGVVAVGASSMANMDGAAPGGPFGFLITYRPAILLVSIAAMALSLGTRRPLATLPALLGGGLLYWGMYAQDNLPIMYGAIALGLLVWAAAFLWARTLNRPNEG